MRSEIEDFIKWVNVNGLNSYISTHIDDINGMTHLDLSKKKIRELPESFGVLQNLTVLKLSLIHI